MPELIRPFDEDGISRGANGIKHFDELPGSLVEMLRASADVAPDTDAVIELDGPKVTYRELWDRAARVAGGLRESGLRRGDRVALRYGN
jgi:acyl-CoA synthetase (AMP-forming)/AMP-acid ligase II